MSDDRKLDGIDASHFQDGLTSLRPDWKRVLTDERVRFIAVKATQGTSYVDPEFRANWQELRSLVPSPNGTPGRPLLLAYHFFDGPNIHGQASHFNTTIGQLRAGEGVMVDFEGQWEGTHAQQKQMLDAVKLLTFRTPLHYGKDEPASNTYPRWIARYRQQRPNNPTCVWQYGGADIPGIKRPVDANRVFDWPALFAACAVTHGDGDLTAEESKMLTELHALLIKGAPGFGVVPTPPEVSRIGRLVNKIAEKLGVTA